MEPYKAKKMPLEYKIDKEMLMLISEANVKYLRYSYWIKSINWFIKYQQLWFMHNSSGNAKSLFHSQ